MHGWSPTGLAPIGVDQGWACREEMAKGWQVGQPQWEGWGPNQAGWGEGPQAIGLPPDWGWEQVGSIGVGNRLGAWLAIERSCVRWASQALPQMEWGMPTQGQQHRGGAMGG